MKMALSRRLLRKAAERIRERERGLDTIKKESETQQREIEKVSSSGELTVKRTVDVKPPEVLDFSMVSTTPMKESTPMDISATEAPEIEREASELRNAPVKAHKIPTQYLKTMSSAWKPPEFTQVDEKYYLIKPFSMANLKWNPARARLEYYVLEPFVTEEQKRQLTLIKERAIDLLDINLFEVKEPKLIKKSLKEKVDVVMKDYGIHLTKDQYDEILYYVFRDFLGLGEIEPLMHDANLEDISCDGVGIPIYVYHRKYGSLPTNISFTDGERLNEFVIRLAQRCGRHISVAEPLLDGALPDGSRVQATFSSHMDIAMHGSTFTIRKFTKDPLTITDIMKFGTLPPLIAAYLWLAIEYNHSILVAGGTATGKTCLLGSLSMFLPADAKIVSIEDTPEVRLPHEHWVQKVVRSGFGREDITGRKQGEVTMYDLLRAALRERPDEIIVGEVRGKEAYVLFQGMASIRGNEKVLLVDKEGHTIREPISNLIGKKLDGYKATTIDPKTGQVKLLPLRACVQHPPREKLYEIVTSTGRRIQLTGDHSVFVMKDGKITEAEVKTLKTGSKIIVPRKIPSGYANVKWLDLTRLLKGIRVVAPNYIRKAVEILGWKEAGELCGVKTISDYYGKNMSALHAESYHKLLATAGVHNSLDEISVKFDRKSERLPAKLKVTDELLRLIGYYISEGSLNTAKKNNSIQLYNGDKRVLEDMRKCIRAVTGKAPREREVHGYGKSKELSTSHKVLFEFLKQLCGVGSSNKRVPDFIFGLSKERIGEFLSGLYAGDGYLGPDNFQYSTKSRQLADDLMYLLLSYGIVAHCYKNQDIHRIEFYREEEMKEFMRYVKPVNKKPKLVRVGRPNPRVHGDVYCDPIKSIREIKLKTPEPVYDLCVPTTENFIGGFGGIMLHNTGHAGMATIHGDSVDSVIHRLQTPPINLSPGLLQHLDIMIILARAKVKGVEVRRAKQIVEVVGLTHEQEPITNTLFEWNPADETFKFSSDKSYVLEEIIKEKGIPESEVWKEIQRRVKVLEWMLKENIRYYKDVGRIIQRYYSDPEGLLKKIT